MTKMTRISTIVPTYNQADYLGACLDSIWFQDHPDLEIIIVNDCSTDHTREVIEEFVRNVEEGAQASYASYYNEENDEIERVYHRRYPEKGRSLVVLHNEKNMGSTPRNISIRSRRWLGFALGWLSPALDPQQP